MMETGMLELFERRHPSVNDTCSRMKEEMSKARALTLQEAGAAFVVLVAGIPVAISVLLLELIIQSLRKRKGSQNETYCFHCKRQEVED